MTTGSSDAAAFFRDVVTRHRRCFWLDGGGAREWSGNRSIIGWLEPDEVSLTYDAARRQVTRHTGDRAVVVGDDVFDVLAGELAADPEGQWFGYLGYACRPDLPARAGGPLPDAVWLRPRSVRLFHHETAPSRAGSPSRRSTAGVPEWYRAAFERVQEELHAGNTYEANLTYRVSVRSDLSPPEAYLRLRALNPAPYAGFLQHDVPG
ncbi:MAG TPA: chorismate-binding protein, partial [Nocardioides sp.]|nr:chorismate-binding protein [Nocardioides sp.]